MLESCKGPCGKRLRGSIGNEWRTGENNNADVFSKSDEVATSGSAKARGRGQVRLPFLPPTSQLEEEVRWRWRKRWGLTPSQPSDRQPLVSPTVEAVRGGRGGHLLSLTPLQPTQI